MQVASQRTERSLSLLLPLSLVPRIRARQVLGGVEFKPRKAGVGGDVKKAGRPDPFAYVPLDKRMLNRRKKRQPVKALSGVLSASKRTGPKRGAAGRR